MMKRTITVSHFFPGTFLTVMALGVLHGSPAQATTFSSSNSFSTKCQKAKYACGQCEEALQDKVSSLIASVVDNPGGSSRRWTERPPADQLNIKPGTTADDFLSKLLGTMRDENAAGGGRLTIIPMGQSQSANDISPGFPRVLVKSPNSELWVAFTTDPKAPNYQSVELMRWDGQAGKFQFQMLNFSLHGGHADLTGKSCVRCHKAESRPIWDTYRAWPGSLSGRDGQLESCNNPNYLLAGASCGANEHGPDTGARAYLNFMHKIAEARDGGTGTSAPDAARLRLLDIPTPNPAVPPQQQNAAQARAEIASVEKDIADKGYFHVPSFPMARENPNVDVKTASNAGPDHLAFDQFQALEACHVSSRLMNRPTWQNLKYAAAGVMYCMNPSFMDATSISDYLPPNVKDRLDKYFQDPDHRQGPTGATTALGSGDGAALDMLYQNTKEFQSHEAQEKTKICQDQLRGYLTTMDHVSKPSEIDRIIQQECVEKRAVTTPSLNAISDPGGVQGVAESAPAASAYLRYLLEPAGIQVGAWSTSRGNGVGDGQSFSFSDQFPPMFKPQAAFLGAYQEAECASSGHNWVPENEGKGGQCDGSASASMNDTCAKLKELSLKSLAAMPDSAWTGLTLRRSSSQGSSSELRGGPNGSTSAQ